MAKVTYLDHVSDSHVRKILHRIADRYEKHITVTSGDRDYVPPGGSQNSLHKKHRAADFHIAGMTDADGFQRIVTDISKILSRSEGYEFIRHGPYTNTDGAHLHLGHYPDGEHTGKVLVKTEGLTRGSGGHYKVKEHDIGTGARTSSEPPARPASRVSITASVGERGFNRYDDVLKVRRLLNGAVRRLRRAHMLHVEINILTETGICEWQMIRAIKLFQMHVVQLAHPDGRIDPHGLSLRILNVAAGGDIRSLPGRVARGRRAKVS